MQPDTAQRATLGLLLERHPRMVTRDYLRETLTGINVDEALTALQEDGLATKLGDLVGATRAAVRGDQLQI